MSFVGVNTASINTTAATIAVADPGAAGNFLLAIWECDGGGQTCTAPDGTWIQLYTGNIVNDGASYFVFYKKSAVGSGTYTFTANQSLNMGLSILAWSNIDNTTPVNVSGITVTDPGGGGVASPASISSPSITTTVDGCTIIYIAIGDPNSNTPASDSFTAPSGMTSRLSFYDSSGWDVIVAADLVQTTHGAIGGYTGIVNRTSAGWGAAAITLALTPTTGASYTIATNIITFITN